MFFVIIRRISVITLVALSLLMNIYYFFVEAQNWHSQSTTQNQVSKWEYHLQSVRNTLPVGTKYVGYVADWDLPGAINTSKQQYTAHTEYTLTRYALAPIIVRRGVNYDWIIGNFSSSNFKNWLKTSIGPYKIQDLGFRIYLIQRIKK
jgi:hypothetical protein